MSSIVVDRRDDAAVLLEAVRVASVWVAINGLLILGVAGLLWRFPIDGWNARALAVTGSVQMVNAALQRRFARSITWPIMHGVLFFGELWAVAVLVHFTRAGSFGQIVFLTAIIWAFGFMPRRHAIVQAAWAFICMISTFAIMPGWPVPAAHALFLGGMVIATSWMALRLVFRADAFAGRERLARLELADLNETLEARVSQQVDELGRLDRLRRFLSPSIAEAVVSEDAASRLAPHRAEIAAVFCDLRGFTAFSAEAEPEDVTMLLGRFHAVLGPLVDRYEATVAGFAGDGVALYFNDPIPCPDPTVRAVKLALDLEAPMGELSVEWRRRGFEVGYGVGIALGYATLGIAGFEQRREYTAVGTVMNLASRLSDEARPSQILLDQRANSAVQDQFRTEPADDLTLKGFARPVPAYRVVR